MQGRPATTTADNLEPEGGFGHRSCIDRGECVMLPRISIQSVHRHRDNLATQERTI